MTPEQYLLELLNNKLTDIKSRNPRYSARALAKKIKVSHSYLILVLNGKRRITRTLASKLCDALQIHPFEKKRLLADLPTHKGRKVEEDYSLSQSGRFLTGLEENQITTFDMFKVFALIFTKDFIFDYEWISKRLNLDISLVQASCELLLRMGVIKKNALGNIYSTEEFIRVKTDNFDNKMRAKKNLECVTDLLNCLKRHYKNNPELPIPPKNESTVVTMSLNTEQIPELIKRISIFRRDVIDITSAHPNHDEVYYFGVFLTPVSQRD